MMRVVSLLLAALCALPASGQKAFEYWPGSSYDPRIPTFHKVLGYNPGDQITTHAGVGSEANIKRLAEIRAAMQKLADPRKTPPAEARKLMAGLPAVISLAYGV